jgi:hypothetical protein
MSSLSTSARHVGWRSPSCKDHAEVADIGRSQIPDCNHFSYSRSLAEGSDLF